MENQAPSKDTPPVVSPPTGKRVPQDPISGQFKPIPQEKKDLALTLIKARANIDEIKAQTGVSKPSIYRIAKDNNIQVAHKKGKAPATEPDPIEEEDEEVPKKDKGPDIDNKTARAIFEKATKDLGNMAIDEYIEAMELGVLIKKRFGPTSTQMGQKLEDFIVENVEFSVANQGEIERLIETNQELSETLEEIFPLAQTKLYRYQFVKDLILTATISGVKFSPDEFQNILIAVDRVVEKP